MYVRSKSIATELLEMTFGCIIRIHNINLESNDKCATILKRRCLYGKNSNITQSA